MRYNMLVGRLILIGVFLAICIPASGGEHSQLKAFPPAKEGMERFVIVLPHKERVEEKSFRVEIVAGKAMATDGVNQMRLGTAIEPRPLAGWGYTYYEVTGSDVVMSTMMAPPEGTPTVEQFVPGKSLTIQYNSRLPIVVYADKGYELRYRIWKASKAFKTAEND